MKKLLLSIPAFVSLFVNSFSMSPSVAGTSINEESPSLKILKKYVPSINERAIKAINLFEESEVSSQDVAKEWTFEAIPEKELFCAPFMRKPESIQRYRHIISKEPNGFHSYHGYDHLSAGIYDIYTIIAEELNGIPVEVRSRFRYNANSPPYTSVSEFLKNVEFNNDHDPEFAEHGISAVPHLFSNTAYRAENCLTALEAVFAQTDPHKFEDSIKSLGFRDAKKYMNLVSKHLRGGFITRFTFSSKDKLDLATYPAPNASRTGCYGKPWVSKELRRASSSFFYEKLENLDHIEDKVEKAFLFNMQYRNISVPGIYNDSSSVKTEIFSLYELPTHKEYYFALQEYVKEDLKSLEMRKKEQAILWLK